MNALWSAMANAFRRTGLPLMSYYAITLGIPVANGAALSDAAFLRHASAVLLVPAAAVALGGVVVRRTVRLLESRTSSRRRSSISRSVRRTVRLLESRTSSRRRSSISRSVRLQPDRDRGEARAGGMDLWE
jgi:hypothetical protein